jgi:formylglycine-generating enzyme required for sulfatase activity
MICTGLVLVACGANIESTVSTVRASQYPSDHEPTVEAIVTSTKPPTVPSAPEPTLVPDQYTQGETLVRKIDGMVMVYVPSGEFEMGYPGGGDTKRMPIHTVVLDGFWMDKYEVSFDQYNQCVVEGKCQPSQYADFAPFNEKNRPVIGVSWFDADTYCNWVGGQLPSEAQWEYAARGPENLKYPWGEQDPDCNLANFGGWEGCTGLTAPIGSFPDGASWIGALDLAGNVYEWTVNWDYSYSAEKQINPIGPAEGVRKIMRGGCWTDFGTHLLAAQRIRFVPTDYADTVGFRCIVLPSEVE